MNGPCCYVSFKNSKEKLPKLEMCFKDKKYLLVISEYKKKMSAHNISIAYGSEN